MEEERARCLEQIEITAQLLQSALDELEVMAAAIREVFS